MNKEDARQMIKTHEFEVDGQKFSFAGLCGHFGLKYNSVYRRVVEKGMTIEDAIKECINDPHTWGYTYNGTETIGGGVYERKYGNGLNGNNN